MESLRHYLHKSSRYTLEELMVNSKIREGLELYESIPNDINKITKYFPFNDPFNVYITEFLDSLSLDKAGNYILNDEYVKMMFIDGYIDDYSETIQLLLKENPINDAKFLRVIDIVNYEIKTIEKKKDNEFKITLEKTYPKPISKKIIYGYHICRTKEIRDNILKSGIRVKYKGFEPKNKYEEKWSKLYFIGDCKINNLKYIISKARKLLRCKKEESPVVRFKIPENATIYKDKTMDKLNDCYFMYCSIPPKYIENSTL